MTGHVFISYSHGEDNDYVEALAKYLNSQGIAVWFDREIISGDRWHVVIQERIDNCSAFIVIMSPSSFSSPWVNREINQAEEMGRPILPLLLRGRRFFRLSDMQYEDVSAGHMPSAAFMARLRGHRPASVLRPPDSPLSTEDTADLIQRHGDAVRIGNGGDQAEAARMLREIVAERTQLLGSDHPATLRSRHDLAYYVGKTGDKAEAVSILTNVIPDFIRVHGPDFHDTLRARHNLAANLGGFDRPDAIRRYVEVIADYTRILGADDLDTLRARHDHALDVGENGDNAQAALLYREIVADRVRLLGADHVDTLLSRHNLAYYTGQSGNKAEAARLYRDIVADYNRVLGPDNPDAQRAQRNLDYYAQ